MNQEPNATTRKPKSNAKLLNLPEAQASQLRELLFEGTSCRDAVEFVQANFGITTGKSAVSDFWRQQCLPLLPKRRHNALEIARLLASSDPKASAPFENAAQSILQQRVFDLCITPSPDVVEIKALSDILHRTRSLDLAKSRLDIARARAELDERRVACREETSSLNRQIKQSAHDRKEKGLRDREKIWAIISPSPHGRDSSTPPTHETGHTPDPNLESPQDQPLPAFE